MEFKRGEKFQQPTSTPTPAAATTENKIIRRTENLPTAQEAKEPAKQDLGFIRGAKVQEEKKEPMMIQRGTKATTNEIKEEKKTAPAEPKQNETITRGSMLTRPKAAETPSTATPGLIQRGTAAASAAPKKEEKPAVNVQAPAGIVRGAALQKPAAVAEEKKANADAKDGGWRKK